MTWESSQPTRWPSAEFQQAGVLRALEWTFLLILFLAASYAFSLHGRLETVSWYLIYLAACSLFVLHYGAFLSSVGFIGPLLLWPLLAGLSFFWSENPGQTLRATIQLSMTVLIAAYVGFRFSLHDICRALFWVLTACALASLFAVAMKIGFAHDHNGVARGIFPHKNVLGGRMVLLLVCATLLFAIGWKRPLAVGGFLLALSLLAISQSGTAILMTLGLGALAPILLTWHRPAPLRAIAYLFALLLGTAAVWFIASYEIDPAGLTLEALGKERTLSGRSVLWDHAMGLVEQRPIAGFGFDGFWDGKDGSASSYVQYFFGQDIENFHSSYLDIAVQLGGIGLALTLVTCLWFAVTALRCLRSGSDATATLPVFFLAFVAVYSLSEYALYRQHSMIQILFGSLAVAGVRQVVRADNLAARLGQRRPFPASQAPPRFSRARPARSARYD